MSGHLFFVSCAAERCAQPFLWRGEGNEFWEERAAWRMSYRLCMEKPNFCNCRTGTATCACFQSLQSLQVLLIKLLRKGKVHVGGCVLGIEALILWGRITHMSVKLFKLL